MIAFRRLRQPLLRAAYWLIPALLLCVLYRYSMRAWFQQDDFAWLSLDQNVHNWRDLWRTLTEPMAQGTLRILSERVLFMSLHSLFGLNHVPFRVAVFATAIVDLLLITAVTRRITGSALAGFAAPVLWLANSNLAVALSWTSAYNQILCAFFLLFALYCFIRFDQSGSWKWYGAQWVVFLMGFLALELNVVYPALAAAYAVLCAPAGRRKRLLGLTAPLFLASGAYALLHRKLGGASATGVYALHWDTSMFSTLLTYWRWVLGPERYTILHPAPAWAVVGATLAIALVLLGFAAWQAVRHRHWVALFGLCWFLIVLSPLLPLRDHLSEYYLTIPSIGLAIAAAYGLSVALRHRYWAIVALLTAGVYCFSSVPIARASSRWYFERGREIRKLVLGVEQAHRLHPGRAILLTGLNDSLFWAGVFDHPFRILGISDVYLAPGAQQGIQPHPEVGEIGDYVLPAYIAKRLLDRDQAVVYDVSGPRLRNITSRVRDIQSANWTVNPPNRIDIGNPWYADELGPTWHRDEGGYRWMPREATVRIGGPDKDGERLFVTGYCPAEQLSAGPIEFTVSVDNRSAGVRRVTQVGEFDVDFPLPAGLAGRPWIELRFSVNRVVREPGGGRELGLAFGTVSVR